jgi:hypothetical protein
MGKVNRCPKQSRSFNDSGRVIEEDEIALPKLHFSPPQTMV